MLRKPINSERNDISINNISNPLVYKYLDMNELVKKEKVNLPKSNDLLDIENYICQSKES